MSNEKRTEFQQEVVDALIESKAINVEAMAEVLGRYGERALREGEDLYQVFNKNSIWNCGNPGLLFDAERIERLAQQKHG